ncbi:hypothetical protein AB0F17_16190 [Nonomuraea sp. NPDC026600]|uniref:hypothetical protein n=1 Tax=Nonomuraea sp. NPDC026600 TaxID=3155363 RepID=UPI0033ED1709
MKGTSAPPRLRKSRAGASDMSPQVTAADRSNDVLLDLDGVCAFKGTTPATERYLRHLGETTYCFRMGRRLVAWKTDVIAYIEAHRIADQESRS